jgi:hypothetical protein
MGLVYQWLGLLFVIGVIIGFQQGVNCDLWFESMGYLWWNFFSVITELEYFANRISSFQHEQARVIYKYALQHIPEVWTQELHKAYTIHEKKYGDQTGIEGVTVSKKIREYQEVGNPASS